MSLEAEGLISKSARKFNKDIPDNNTTMAIYYVTEDYNQNKNKIEEEKHTVIEGQEDRFNPNDVNAFKKGLKDETERDIA